MLIQTVDDMFSMLETLGFEEKKLKNETLYTLGPKYGQGSIKLMGNRETFYLIRGDFCLKESMSLTMDVKIKDKFIELTYVSDPFEITVDKKPLPVHHLSCHVNFDVPSFQVVFPAGRLTYNNVIIREAYIKDHFPVFYNQYFQKAQAIDKEDLQNPKIMTIILDLFTRDYDTYANQVYMNSKILEIMSLLIAQIDAENTPPINSNNYAIIQECKRLVDANYIEPLSLVELAKVVGSNVKIIKEGFKSYYGVTVFQHVRNIRMRKSVQLLKDSHMTVEEIARQVGYASTTHYYKNFRNEYGITPRQYRKQMKVK